MGSTGSGDPGLTSIGGDGGSASADTDSNNAYDTIIVEGGNGGNGPNAGKGGDAGLSASGTLTVGSFTVKSGANGLSGGTCGRAGLIVETLIAPIVNLVKQGGGFSASIGTLDVTGNYTDLYLDGTGLSDAFIGTIRLGDKALTIAKDPVNGGTGMIGTLQLVGSGTFSNDAVTIGNLIIDGGTINSGNFNLINTVSYANSDITLGSGGAKFDTTGGDQSVSRALIGTGGLTKIGTNMLTLTGI